jgi:hypothetical protein
VEDQVVTTPGSYMASAPLSAAGNWIMQTVAFRRAGGNRMPSPSAPTSPVANTIGSTQINLSWGAASETGGAIGKYLIERCSGVGCSTFAQVGISTATTTFNDTGLTASTTYRYRIRAQDGAGTTGPYSDIVTAVL